MMRPSRLSPGVVFAAIGLGLWLGGLVLMVLPVIFKK